MEVVSISNNGKEKYRGEMVISERNEMCLRKGIEEWNMTHAETQTNQEHGIEEGKLARRVVRRYQMT